MENMENVMKGILHSHGYFKPLVHHHVSSMYNFVHKALPQILSTFFPLVVNENENQVTLELLDFTVVQAKEEGNYLKHCKLLKTIVSDTTFVTHC